MWQRVGKDNYYPFLLKALQSLKKSMCMSNRNALFDINRNMVLFFKNHPDFPDASNQHHMQLSFANAFGNHRGVNGQILQCMKDAERTQLPKFLLTFVPVVTFNANGKPTTGHATLLLFDLVNKHQVYFDPSGRDRDIAPFQNAPLIPGFQPVPVSECAFTERIRAHRDYAMQHAYESQEYEGVCGIMCLLVWQLCSRFNYFHLRNMAEVLVEAYPDRADRRSMIGRFVRLYRSSSAELVNRAFPARAGARCLSYVPRTRTLCHEPSCADSSSSSSSPSSSGDSGKKRKSRIRDVRTYCALHRAMYVTDAPLSTRRGARKPSCALRLTPRDWSWRKKGKTAVNSAD